MGYRSIPHGYRDYGKCFGQGKVLETPAGVGVHVGGRVFTSHLSNQCLSA
ncbi:MAG: hypothetical protein ACOX1G_04005 [bacterium]|nr:hypothetical protein [bacterium]